jgi:hypothetical protein
MVHELDGTKNEWGWCKQKVYFRIDVHGGDYSVERKSATIAFR